MRNTTFLALVLVLSGCGCGDDDGTPPMRDAGGDATVPPDGATPDGGGACTISASVISGDTELAPGPHGIAGNGDLAIENGLVRAVFAAVEKPAFYAASGGTLVDFHPIGSGDAWSEFSQLGGVAQELQIRYTEMDVAEMDATHVIVEMRGHIQPVPGEPGELPVLDPDPGTGLTMVTRYELRCDEPVLHITSTVTNTTENTYARVGGFTPMDLLLWGGTGSSAINPFCPVRGQGDRCTPFSFADPLGTLVGSEYVGTTGTFANEPLSYALWPEEPTLAGFLGVHGPTVSSVGDFAPMITVFAPGASKSHRRALAVAPGADTASTVDLALEALSQQGRFDLATVTGQVTMPAGETLSANEFERPMVVLAVPGAAMPTDPATWIPTTMVRVEADGSFSARVKAGRISWEVRALGRAPLRGEGGNVDADGTLDLGTIAIEPAPRLHVTVRDATMGAPAGMPARVVVLGADGTEDPFFGRREAGSPAANVALTDENGEVDVPILPGTYDVYATHGMGWTLGHQRVTVAAGTGGDAQLDLRELAVFPDGFVTADFHVHSGASFDSSVPQEDRVRAFLAEGVEAIVSTEHDVIWDYAPAITDLETTLPMAWQGRLRSFVGVESTNNIPQPMFPHTVGHYNGFPIEAIPGAHKNGAPDDEYHTAAEIFDLLRGLPSPADPVVQLNHARSERAGVVWLGYFDSCGFDPTAPFAMDDACWGSATGMGTRGWDFDAIEIVNGKDPVSIVNALRDWYALLRFAPEGQLPVGTANSDSHDLVTGHAGWPVTVIRPAAALDDAQLVASVQSGAVAGSLGVFVWANARETAVGTATVEPGRDPLGAATGLVTLHVTVNAAPWIPVEEIRIRAGGVVVQRIALPTPMPADPFGIDGVVRFDDDVILTTAFTADTFLTVEAGFALPVVADTDGDGVVDAMDRDGDGDVDGDDMAMGTGVELGESPMPMAAVAAGALPFGFTNPIYVDRDGDGMYDPIGSPLVD